MVNTIAYKITVLFNLTTLLGVGVQCTGHLHEGGKLGMISNIGIEFTKSLLKSWMGDRKKITRR